VGHRAGRGSLEKSFGSFLAPTGIRNPDHRARSVGRYTDCATSARPVEVQKIATSETSDRYLKLLSDNRSQRFKAITAVAHNDNGGFRYLGHWGIQFLHDQNAK
jgi:hypothetical protein